MRGLGGGSTYVGDAESQKLVAGGDARCKPIVKDWGSFPIASDAGSEPITQSPRPLAIRSRSSHHAMNA